MNMEDQYWPVSLLCSRVFVNCQLAGRAYHRLLQYLLNNTIKGKSPATRICWRRGISSQSKQHMVSPVRKRVPFRPKCSLILRRCDIKLFVLLSSFLSNMSFSFCKNNTTYHKVKVIPVIFMLIMCHTIGE